MPKSKVRKKVAVSATGSSGGGTSSRSASGRGGTGGSAGRAGSSGRVLRRLPGRRAAAQGSSPVYTPAQVKVAGPSSPFYIGVMLGLMILGLLWLVVFYLWGPSIGFMSSLGNWNFAVGFALIIGGLMMTMRWR